MISSKHRIGILGLVFVFLLAVPALVAADETTQRLEDSFSFSYSLNTQEYLSISWNIPENTDELSVYITDGQENQELLLKYGSAVTGASFSAMEADADYVANDSTWDESITIDALSVPPLQQGRYYASVLNRSNTSVTGRINFLAHIKDGVPIATTRPATQVDAYSAQLNGMVAPNGSETTCYFEYGETDAYGESTGPITAPVATEVGLSMYVGSLAAGTEYHFRLVAENAFGTSHGEDMSFTTPAYELTKLYFPHFDTREPWITEFGLNNLGDTAIDGTLGIFDDLGGLIAEQAVSVPAHGSAKIDVGTVFGVNASGYGVFAYLEGDVAGYTAYSQPERYKAALPAVPATELAQDTLYAAHVDSDDKWWTGFAFVNTLPTTADFSIDFDDGSSAQVSIPPYGHQAMGVNDLFGASLPDANVATITPAAGLIGFELFSWGDQLAGIPLSEFGGDTVLFPTLPRDGVQWLGMAMYNPGATQVQVTMNTYATDGAATGDLNLTLDPGQKLVGLPGDLNVPTEADWALATADGPVHGFFLFGDIAGFYLDGIASVDPLFNQAGFMDIAQDGATTLNLVNTSAQDLSFDLQALDASGAVLDTYTQASFPAHSSLALDPDTIFPDFVGQVVSARFVGQDQSGPVFGGFEAILSGDGSMAHALAPAPADSE